MAAETEAKIKEYETVVGQFRTLTDIRFKLLGLLPLGTIGTLIALKDVPEISSFVGLPIEGQIGGEPCRYQPRRHSAAIEHAGEAFEPPRRPSTRH
jgi:hypothetical protein